MDYKKWKITFSNSDWLGEGKEVVCEATNEELIDMTAQSYEFREMLDCNEVCGGLTMFWEGWCDMNEEEDYQGDSLCGPSFTKVPYQNKTLQNEIVQGWEDLLGQQ